MKKVLVLGLDGVPLDLVKPWADQGELPALGSVMSGGIVSLLNSTIPHTSAPAWSSFMTGKNPGKTNIFDFLYREKDSYNFHPNNSCRREGKEIWEILSEAGKKVVVCNIPVTYPVKKVNGCMISGFMTPYLARDYAHPANLIDEIEEALGKYRIYPFETYSEKKDKRYFDACHRLLDIRTDTALYLMKNKPWDFFMNVFFDTDRILHQLWHHVEPRKTWRKSNGKGEKNTFLLSYFRHLDESIGKLLECAGDDTQVMILSDHGMGPAHNIIALNTWLLRQGLIKLRNGAVTRIKRTMFERGITIRNVHRFADSLGIAKHAEYKVLYGADRILKKMFLSFDDVDWAKTVAYSFGRSNGPVFINLQGREPCGIVHPGKEYERLREEIKKQALEMRDPVTGEKLVGDVAYKEDIYQGPYMDDAPDIILNPKSPYDKFYGLSDFGANKVRQPMYRFSGMHRQHGMLLMKGPRIRQGVHMPMPEITDLAPTILYAMDLPVPDDMDGRPLVEVFQDRKQIVRSRIRSESGKESEDRKFSPAEDVEIEKRLRDLGYLA